MHNAVNLQGFLPLGKSNRTDLQVFYQPPDPSGGNAATGKLNAYMGFELLQSTPTHPDSLQYKIAVGTLASLKFPKRYLCQALGHDSRTIAKYERGLKETDPEKWLRCYSGRGPDPKITPEWYAVLRTLYLENRHLPKYRKRIGAKFTAHTKGKVTLSPKTLSTYFARFRREADEPDSAPPGQKAAAAKITLKNPTLCSLLLKTVTYSPQLADSDVPFLPPEYPACFSYFSGHIHHAGLLLLTPWLRPVLSQLVDIHTGLAQILLQLLLGAVNVEQSKFLCAESLGLLLGEKMLNRNDQRSVLKGLPGQATALEAARINLPLTDAIGSDVFLYDGHSKLYTGGLPIPKGWLGNIHDVGKMLNLDIIHTESGMPCFICPDDNYYDFRERFRNVRALFNSILPEERRRGKVWVIDRAIFAIDVFSEDFTEDYLVTWEKGYAHDGWCEDKPCIEYVMERPRNDPEDIHSWSFKIQEHPWPKRPQVRRIIIRTETPDGKEGEAAILSNAPLMFVATQLVQWICNRWIQENNIKVLVELLGLNQLVSYSSIPYRALALVRKDRPVTSKEAKDARSEKHSVGTQLKETLFNRENLQDEAVALENEYNELVRGRERVATLGNELLDKLKDDEASVDEQRQADEVIEQLRIIRKQLAHARKSLTSKKPKLDSINVEAARLKQEMAEIKERLASIEKTDSRLDMLIRKGMVKLDTDAKWISDMLRLTAFNSLRNLLLHFRPIYRNYRDQWGLLVELIRSPGEIRIESDRIVVILWPSIRLSGKAKRAVVRLCRLVSNMTRKTEWTGLPLQIEIQTTAELRDAL